MTSSFFVTGGTMAQGAPSYVVREADLQLADRLREGEFCYVLTSRQMGKSSLMIRTAAQLASEGHAVVIVDLTSLGQNVTVEQWYDGLLAIFGEQLGCEDALEDYWLDQERVPPLRRWSEAIGEMVLPRLGQRRLTVFVDEVDIVRSLPFPADEFFAAIRAFYNTRTTDLEIARLSFCLLGVAAPSDLIEDPRLTPFNIGQRIELTDFSLDEAAQLGAGFADETARSRLVRRVYHWTHGHPYLTQRLCQAVVEQQAASPADVDRLVHRLFLDSRSMERDDNLHFVSDRLLSAGDDPAPLLGLYRRVRRGLRTRYEAANPLVTKLLLSGVVRERGGRLACRNRIYARAFSLGWIRANLAAPSWRLVLRYVLVGMAIMAPAVLALTHANGTVAKQERNSRRTVALLEAERGIGLLNNTQLTGLWRLARACRSVDDQPTVAGWYKRIWAGWEPAVTGRLVQVVGQDGYVYGVAFGPENRLVATCGTNGTARVWRVDTGRPVTPPLQHSGFVREVAFSPDGRRVATICDRGRETPPAARVWDIATGQPVTPPLTHSDGENELWSVAYSTDGRLVASACANDGGTIRIWDVERGELRFPAIEANGATAIRLSPSGRWLGATCANGGVLLIDPTSGTVHTLPGQAGSGAEVVAFSADGRVIAAGGNHAARAWLVETQQALGPPIKFPEDSGALRGVGLSSDGSRLALSHLGGLAGVYDTATGRPVGETIRHANDVWRIEFTPDDRLVVTTSRDGTACCWDAATGHRVGLPLASVGEVLFGDLSPDGRLLITSAADGNARIWRVPEPTEYPTIPIGRPVQRTAYRPDGSLVVASGDMATGLQVARWSAAPLHQLAATPLVGERILGLSTTGRYVVVGGPGDETELTVYDVDRGSPVGPSFHVGGRCDRAAVADDGTMLVAQCRQPNLAQAFRLPAGERYGPVLEVTGGVRQILLSPDGSRVDISGKAGQIHVWRTSDWQPLFTELPAHQHEAEEVCFSLDNALLATTGRDARVNIWQTTDPPTLLSSLVHQNDVGGVGLTPDKGYVVTTGGGENPWLWEPHTGQACGPAERLGGWKLAVRSDGGQAAVCRGNDVVLLPIPTDLPDVETIERRTELALGFTLGPGDAPKSISWREWQELWRQLQREGES